MKKTKKYYRDEIAKSYRNACAIFNEAIEKYGTKRKTRGHRDAKIKHVTNEWNGDIIGFYYNVYKNELSVDICWQGDSTDGEDCVIFNKHGIVLPAEVWFDGRESHEDHSDVRFTEEHLYQSMKNFAEAYLK